MRTKENLMRAFAGESQARNRYDIAAEYCKKQGYHVLYDVFRYTAEQEKEHAKIFYDFLKDMDGQTIYIDGGYPVNNNDDIVKLLEDASHNEFEERNVIYPEFAKIAREEGFPKIAYAFEEISKIEETHAIRFEYYIDLIKNNELFDGDENSTWHCTKCGYHHRGKTAPKECPVCHHEQGYFTHYEPHLVKKH